MKDRNYLEWLLILAIDNQPGMDGEKLHRFVGQIPAKMSDTRILGEEHDPVSNRASKPLRHFLASFTPQMSDYLGKVSGSIERENISAHSLWALYLAR